MNTSTSLFAKALATENIFVSFESNAKTATFDVTSRTLIIPDWKVSNVLRDMIVAHEVAHALFTPAKELLSALEAAKGRKLHADGYKACVNVIEDARIERCIKEKFPGCRRDFYSGYKEILDTDLFQLKSLNMDDLTIVDKVNLHFKFGLFGLMNISINDAEQAFIDRVAATKSFDDVVALADELYAMQAEEDEKKGRTRSVDGDGNTITDLTDAMQTMQKDGDLEKAHKVSNLRYEDYPHLSYPLPKCNSSEAIITFNDLLIDCRTAMRIAAKHYGSTSHGNDADVFSSTIENAYSGLEQFRKESTSTVRELVAQFERRKAAEEIRKERMKPTGTINPDRLHQFKTHDDIFLRNLVKHEGKKHGMVMLIDWSGSMGDCIDGVVRQLLTLTWFCRKANIPFEVFLYTEFGGFSDSELQKKHKVDKYEDRFERLYGATYLKSVRTSGDNLNLNNVALRQVLSSSMTDSQILEMEQVLWMFSASMERSNPNCHYLMGSISTSMGMHGTPSCEALMAIHDFIPKFRAATGSQIVDFIHITDGDPTGLGRAGHNAYVPVKSVRVQHISTGRTLTINADRRGYLRSLNSDIQYFLVDEIRKLGCVTVGFSIGPMSGIGSHLLNKFVRIVPDAANLNDPVHRLAFDKGEKSYNDFYKKENFLPANTTLTPGFDEYYIVRPVKPLGAEMDDTANATNSTLTKIRNQFLKSLNSRKVSRVFLSRFIDLIAGRRVGKFKIMG